MSKNKKSEEEKVSQLQTFVENRKHYSDKDIQFDLLYTQRQLLTTQRQLLEKTEKIRANTSTLIYWLIVIPIVIGVIAFIVSS